MSEKQEWEGELRLAGKYNNIKARLGDWHDGGDIHGPDFGDWLLEAFGEPPRTNGDEVRPEWSWGKARITVEIIDPEYRAHPDEGDR